MKVESLDEMKVESLDEMKVESLHEMKVDWKAHSVASQASGANDVNYPSLLKS
jgi:hypothetical protein